MVDPALTVDKLRSLWIAVLAGSLSAAVVSAPVSASTVKYQASGGPTTHEVIGYFTVRHNSYIRVAVSMKNNGACSGGVDIGHTGFLFDHSSASGTEYQSIDSYPARAKAGVRYKVSIGFGCHYWTVKVLKVPPP